MSVENTDRCHSKEGHACMHFSLLNVCEARNKELSSLASVQTLMRLCRSREEDIQLLRRTSHTADNETKNYTYFKQFS